ncbi:MAG: hypothetical protein Q9213_007735 [Squamulea squamosa]
MSGHVTQGFFALVKSDLDKPPPLLKQRSSKGFILTTICVARAGIAQQDVQHWVPVLLAVYGAALLACAPVCGFLADRSTSRRLPLLVGLLALAGATLMLCFGHTIGVLVTGRLLQGISAAIVWTVGLALMVDTVGQKEIGQAMGYISISMSVSILLAPLLGGIVYDRGGYYGVYYMAFALIMVDIILRTVMIEKKIARKWEKQDEPAIVSGPSEKAKVPTAGQRKDSSLPNADSVLHVTLLENKVAKKCAVADGPVSEANPTPEDPAIASRNKRTSPPSNQDIIVEEPESRSDSHSPQACPPQVETSSVPTATEVCARPPVVVLLSSRRLLSALYCALVQSALLAAWDAVLPLRVNSLFGWHSLGAGLIFLPLVLPSFVAPLVGAFSDRYGSRLPTSIGFLLATPFLILLRIVEHGGKAQIVTLCVLLACLGTALTIVMTPLAAEVTYILKGKEKHHPGLFGQTGAYAQAYGLFNCAFAGGMLVGPLWAGAVVEKHGWATMCLTLGILAVVSAVPAFLFTNGWIGEQWKKRSKGEAQGEA